MYDSVLVAAFGGVTMNLDGSDELHVHPGILYLAQFINGQWKQWKSFCGRDLLLQMMPKYSANTLHDVIFVIYFKYFQSILRFIFCVPLDPALVMSYLIVSHLNILKQIDG